MANAVKLVPAPCYVLELSKEEAQFIKGLTQNYISGPDNDPQSEPTADRTMRNDIWHALDGEGV